MPREDQHLGNDSDWKAATELIRLTGYPHLIDLAAPPAKDTGSADDTIKALRDVSPSS